MIDEELVININKCYLEIPEAMRDKIKNNMLLTFIDENTLIGITEEDLDSLGSNRPYDPICITRFLKANSARLILDEKFRMKIPSYIYDQINFKKGKVIFNNKGNFKIVGIELKKSKEESNGKKI